jgi:dolichol-phosphate mannosyltransferase
MSVIVVTPTYNEADNVTTFLRQVREALPEAAIMVVDDSSPDGTAAVATATCAEVGNAEVVVRSTKEGLGSAYRHAFAMALASEHDIVVHLDTDLSHDPARLPAFVAAIEAGADMVIGSRYVTGGATVDWPLHRRLLSKWGNAYTAGVLGLRAHDVTSGYRAYRMPAMRVIDPASTRAEGYAFLTELALRASDRGLVIAEVPIVFADRTAGSSKMSLRIIAESMLLVTWWGVARRVPFIGRMGRRLVAALGR